MSRSALGLSPIGEKLARYISRTSLEGSTEQKFETEIVAPALGMSVDAITPAIRELAAHHFVIAEPNATLPPLPSFKPTARLFTLVDPLEMRTHPEGDAVEVARELVKGDGTLCSEMACVLGWGPRRMNPACAHLVASGRADGNAPAAPPFDYSYLRPNARTGQARAPSRR